jgi:hypothetical protein
MTANEIRKAGPSGKMTQVSGNHNILFDNGVILESNNSQEKLKLWNKLKRMGFEQHFNFSSDEVNGIKQAGLNGENPFAYSIICSDSKLNEISR